MVLRGPARRRGGSIASANGSPMLSASVRKSSPGSRPPRTCPAGNHTSASVSSRTTAPRSPRSRSRSSPRTGPGARRARARSRPRRRASKPRTEANGSSGWTAKPSRSGRRCRGSGESPTGGCAPTATTRTTRSGSRGSSVSLATPIDRRSRQPCGLGAASTWRTVPPRRGLSCSPSGARRSGDDTRTVPRSRRVPSSGSPASARRRPARGSPRKYAPSPASACSISRASSPDPSPRATSPSREPTCCASTPRVCPNTRSSTSTPGRRSAAPSSISPAATTSTRCSGCWRQPMSSSMDTGRRLSSASASTPTPSSGASRNRRRATLRRGDGRPLGHTTRVRQHRPGGDGDLAPREPG